MSFGFLALIKNYNSARAQHHLSNVVSNMPTYLREDLGLSGRSAHKASMFGLGVAPTAHRQIGLL